LAACERSYAAVCGGGSGAVSHEWQHRLAYKVFSYHYTRVQALDERYGSLPWRWWGGTTEINNVSARLTETGSAVGATVQETAATAARPVTDTVKGAGGYLQAKGRDQITGDVGLRDTHGVGHHGASRLRSTTDHAHKGRDQMAETPTQATARTSLRLKEVE
jgi:hypothetical protein